MDLAAISANLLTPQVLFFALGMLATLVQSDLEFPVPFTRALSLYLLFSIGMHGGVELARAGLEWTTLKPLVAGVCVSAMVPLLVFVLLRRFLGPADAAAVGATYGSISAVTFVTAASFLDDRGIAWSGSMVASMALMESPAIVVGVLLARRALGGEGDAQRATLRSLLRESFLGSAVFLLLGALVIGAITGEKGWESVAPFADAPFKGVLCLFLLDMGLIAARRLDALRRAGPVLALFAVVAPLALATVAIGLARLLELGSGDALLFTVLCASASYIAVPAAVQSTLPEANPSLFLPMSLALTFPFNIAIGIPVYSTVIEAVWSAP
ncbi:MAG: sodium-dependent bicarbonate transport family permease [Planctomycetota bacterium]